MAARTAPAPNPTAKDRTMRMNRTRRTVVAVVALGLLAGAASVIAATAEEIPEPSYTVTVSAPAVTLGETVEVTVAASDIEDLYAYDLTLEFDRDAFVYVPDSAASGTSGTTVDTATQGTVRVVHTKLGTSPAVDGDVVLATVTLRAEGAGTTSVDAVSLVSVATDTETTTTSDVGSAEVTVTTKKG